MTHALIASEGSFSAGTRVEILGVPDDHGIVMVRTSTGEVIDTDEQNLVKLRLRTVPIRPDRSDGSQRTSKETGINMGGSDGTHVQSEV